MGSPVVRGDSDLQRRDSMTSPTVSPRLLSFGLLVVLVAGCATGNQAAPGNATDSGPAVTSDDIERTPNEPIEKLLMARVPGVWITRAPDGGIAVRIRGATTITGSNEPLYVVDGVAIQPGPGGSLTGINPYDIESIEVLKDAAGTTMYGSRGANGVIVIKMKQRQ
jgi:TonB-dependent SusC/RagA subfamily outer membrane receptor